MAVAIALMAKLPRPGQVKTRLAAAVGAAGAAALAHAFLQDSAARIVRLAAESGAVPVALHAPAEAGREMAALLPPGFLPVAQAEGDVGRRMERGFAALFALGHGPVLLTGSDVPTLPEALLREALDAVRGGSDAAFVPVRDGGYCAVALARPAPALFAGMAWSTASVMAGTASAAARAGLRLHATAAWYDVDEAADLDTLRAEFAGIAPPGCAPVLGDAAPNTRAMLVLRGTQ